MNLESLSKVSLWCLWVPSILGSWDMHKRAAKVLQHSNLLHHPHLCTLHLGHMIWSLSYSSNPFTCNTNFQTCNTNFQTFPTWLCMAPTCILSFPSSKIFWKSLNNNHNYMYHFVEGHTELQALNLTYTKLTSWLKHLISICYIWLA